MNLVWFLTIATIFSLLLGEFGQFPFASSTSINLTEILLGVTLGFLLIWKVVIQKKFEIDLGFKLITLFWMVGFLSLIFSGELKGGVYLIRFILYSSAYYLGYQLIKEKQIKLIFLNKLIVIIGLIFSVLGFIQLVLIPDFQALANLGYDPHKGRLTSTFLDPNFAGAFLNISFLISLYLAIKLKSKIYFIIGEILALAILLTFSRSAYLAFFIQLLLFSLLKAKKLLIILLLGLIIAFVFVPRFTQRIQGGLQIDKSASERLVSWQNGWEIFSQSPVMGVGFNNLRVVMEKSNLFKVYSENGGNSGAGVDSSLLFILATTGIVGFLAYLFWWGYLIVNIFKIRNFFAITFGCILLGLLINSQFINSMVYSPIMLIIYLVSGALISEKKYV